MTEDYTENIKDREPLDTENMLKDGFLKELQKTDKKSASQIRTASNEIASEVETGIAKDFNQEKVLVDLYDTRDGLLDCFGSVNYNSGVGRSLTKHINVLGSCIQKMGGAVDKFNPLDHISGLQEPDLRKNAQKVLEVTKACYKLGSVQESKVYKDDRTIVIIFAGQDSDTFYKATGTISPKKENTWIGNEAIDYIYTPSEGKMSVKALDETGKWTDRSSSYDIYWELEENNQPPKNEKNEKNEKEISVESQNIVSQDRGSTDKAISSDFPIVEEIKENKKS